MEGYEDAAKRKLFRVTSRLKNIGQFKMIDEGSRKFVMSTSGAGNEKAVSGDFKTRQELLLKVYDAAINEYRFNVNLGWDRTKFFLVASAGLIVAGIGLM